MTEIGEYGNISFQQILKHEGIDVPNAGPKDFRMEQATQRNSSFENGESDGEWYAIPKKIFVTNPLTGEHEDGRLTENGAFVADTAKLLDRDPRHTTLESKVLVLGQSVLKKVDIGWGTIVNGATITRAKVGRESLIDTGTSIFSGAGWGPEVRIGRDVTIGKDVGITFLTDIREGVIIGDGAQITESTIGAGVVIEATDEEDTLPVHQMAAHRGHKTFIGRSTVDAFSTIETNAQIEATTVGRSAVIGRGAYLAYTNVADLQSVPSGTEDVKLSPAEIHEKIEQLLFRLSWTTYPDKLNRRERKQTNEEIKALRAQLRPMANTTSSK